MADPLFWAVQEKPASFELTFAGGMLIGAGSLHEHAAAAVAVDGVMRVIGAANTGAPGRTYDHVCLMTLQPSPDEPVGVSIDWRSDRFVVTTSLVIDDRARGFFDEFCRVANDDERALAWARSNS